MEIEMAGVASTGVQQILDEIDKLKNIIECIGEAARTKLSDIKATEAAIMPTIPLASGKVDEAGWSQLSEVNQRTNYNRLLLVRDSLRSTAGLDGPTDERHLMYGEYASNLSICLWLGLSFLFVSVLLYGVISHWDRATSTDFAEKLKAATAAIEELDNALNEKRTAELAEVETKKSLESLSDDRQKKEDSENNLKKQASIVKKKTAEVEQIQEKTNKLTTESIRAIVKGGASEQVVLGMVSLLGALGGALHIVGSLIMYIGNGQLKRRWLPYYLSLPIVGAALAPVVYMLLRVGILTPTGVANGGSATTNLNLVAIYAFAALTGMFAKTATDKLNEVFGTLFRTGEPAGKDRIGSGRSPNTNS